MTTDAIAGRSVRDGNKITTPIYVDDLLIGCHVWDHYAQGISHFEPMLGTRSIRRWFRSLTVNDVLEIMRKRNATRT